ncbi:hypothetical protein PROFUN_02190 [Planoprotostelium fungivorum]|uniref:Uncharacterized protein n=1 Tax=Planoprotostelium fungivorum TaxID=1890364 RepID=A0A2P6NZD0_9EUKA|nr:hypothetical protein PROFUN_02190 [Planoprotostelium fungivorum]
MARLKSKSKGRPKLKSVDPFSAKARAASEADKDPTISKGDDEKLPRKFTEMIKLTKRVEAGPKPKKKKEKVVPEEGVYAHSDGRYSVAGKQIAKIANMKPYTGESMERFEKRIKYATKDARRVMQNAPEETELTNKKKKKLAFYDKRKKQRIEKKYGKLNQQQGGGDSSDSDEDNEDEMRRETKEERMKSFELRRDQVEFGEVAQKPPILSVLPKRKKNTQKKQEVVEEEENRLQGSGFKWKNADEVEKAEKQREKTKRKREQELDPRLVAEQQRMELLRGKVMKAYKDAKNRKEKIFNQLPIG